MSIRTWLTEPYTRPVRKRWQVILAMFIKGMGEGVERTQLNQRIAKLEIRIEELESGRVTTLNRSAGRVRL